MNDRYQQKKPESWKDRFYRDYLSKDRKTFNDAQKLKADNLPSSLYRYRAWNDCTLEEIRTDTIYLSKLDRFNDIFDSWVGCNPEYLIWEKREGSGKSKAKPGPLSGEIRKIMETIDPEKKLKSLMFNPAGKDVTEPGKRLQSLVLGTDKSMAAMEENLNKTIRAMVRIACFTTKPVNMPMWYHYARGSRVLSGPEGGTRKHYAGVCLEYDMTQADRIPLVRESIFPVNYQFKMPDMLEVLSEHPFQVLKYSATLKNMDWAYEDEWRLILSLGDFYHTPEEIPEEAWSEGIKYQFLPVKAVYMGDQIDPENREELEKIAEEKGFRLYQMKAARGRYVPEEVC